MSKRFPVGGSRQAVYSFMHHNGFQMGNHDKHWKRFDGVEAHIYGAGSMARIVKGGAVIEDGELDKVVRASAYGSPAGSES